MTFSVDKVLEAVKNEERHRCATIVQQEMTGHRDTVAGYWGMSLVQHHQLLDELVKRILERIG